MKLSECQGKEIRVICIDGQIVEGYCDTYRTKEEAESEEERDEYIYICIERCLIEIFADEITSVEEIKK